MNLGLLTGIETEYGLFVEGRTPTDQVEDAAEFVRSHLGPSFVGWNYDHESPRNDLRGFKLERLSVDPEDWKFESGSRVRQSDASVRSDRVMHNGGRYYNDHGHPEYATPECLDTADLVCHDLAGHATLRHCATQFTERTGRRCKVYKNNTDFHGASYGTHESYLVPRAVGFEALYAAVMPMLVARTILCGAGKACAESGEPCDFQLSQRADFFMESANAETLYRRPIFNTRDEPHADPRKWIRLHVISGDANMNPNATARKVSLMHIALRLAEAGHAPRWPLADPVRAIRQISRDTTRKFEISEGVSAYAILDSYLEAAVQHLDLCSRGRDALDEIARVMNWVRSLDDQAIGAVDWVAKEYLLRAFSGDLDGRAVDLAYCDLDRDEGLYYGLAAAGMVPDLDDLVELTEAPPTRAAWRALALERWPEAVRAVTWSSLTLAVGSGEIEVALPPDIAAPPNPESILSVEDFITELERCNA